MQRWCCQMKVLKKVQNRSGHAGKTVGVGYMAAPLRVWRWTLLTVIAKAILVRNLLFHSFEGMVGSAGHNWMLGVKLFCLGPIMSAAAPSLCPFLNMKGRVLLSRQATRTTKLLCNLIFMFLDSKQEYKSFCIEWKDEIREFNVHLIYSLPSILRICPEFCIEYMEIHLSFLCICI